jgi:hypothetical protein
MCHIVQVQGRAGYRHPATVLEQALDTIERTLYRPDASHWSQYWQQVRETLKYPASQLESLQSRLITTQQPESLLEQQSVDADVEVPFEVLHLPELEVLIAVPLQKGCYLDLDRAQSEEGWLVVGDYYPFEIHIEDFTFIVSAAGEVVVSIQGFPVSLVRQVREQLRLVAQTLYTTRRPRFTARVEEPDALEPLPPEDEGG